MDLKVVGVVFARMDAMVAVDLAHKLLDVACCSAAVVVVVV